jgi:XRE family transcriptional regulator, regulator of sulfur utilization
MPHRAPAPIRRAFGRVLRARRRAVGVSQEALALEANLSPTFVKYLERGERMPTLATVMALAAVLGCSAADLVAEVEGSIARR